MMLAGVIATGAAGCGSGAEAGGPSPAVLESVPPAEDDDDATADGGENGESSETGSATDSEGDSEDVDPTPVPASSDGPALNWPVPEPPEEIYEPTEEGAEALLQHWFDARHYARITGDTEPLEYVSLGSCALCQSHLERLDEVFSNDGWYVSEPDSIEDFYLQMESETVVSGLLALDESDFESFWDGASHGVTEAETPGAYQFRAIYDESRWQAVSFSFVGAYEPILTDEEGNQETGPRESEAVNDG